MEGESRRARRARRARRPEPAELPWFRLPPPPGADDDAPVLVLGAGLGGCALARALAGRGRRSVLIERGPDVAAGASGNPAAVAKPFVTRAPSEAETFHLEAFRTLRRQLDEGDDDADGTGSAGIGRRAGFRPCGALQLTERPYPPRDPYRVVDADEASALAATALRSGGVAFDGAGWLDPAALCRALADSSLVERLVDADVVGIERGADDHWHVRIRDGRRRHAPLLVLATGNAIARTPWTETFPSMPARGQISRFRLRPGSTPPTCVVSGRHYVIPDGETLYVGATFERGEEDHAVRETDHAANRAGLAVLLPDARVHDEPISGHAGVRATTPDRLPLVGPVPDGKACRRAYANLGDGHPPARYPPLPTLPGLATLGGFGSRGVVTAPLCAELLADWITGGRDLQRWMPLVSPVRFTLRALRRS